LNLAKIAADHAAALRFQTLADLVQPFLDGRYLTMKPPSVEGADTAVGLTISSGDCGWAASAPGASKTKTACSPMQRPAYHAIARSPFVLTKF